MKLVRHILNIVTQKQIIQYNYIIQYLVSTLIERMLIYIHNHIFVDNNWSCTRDILWKVKKHKIKNSYIKIFLRFIYFIKFIKFGPQQ